MNDTQKPQRLALMIVSVTCAAAIGVCIIVNIAMQGEPTWAVYPLLSVLFAWAITAPALLLSRRRIEASLAVTSILALPYLFFMNMATPGADWFIGLALPVTAIGMAALWLCFFVTKKTIHRPLYTAALQVLILGVFVAPAITALSHRFTNEPVELLSFAISPFVCLIAAAVLFIVGYARKKY